LIYTMNSNINLKVSLQLRLFRWYVAHVSTQMTSTSKLKQITRNWG
jgi:hypothetical protein